MSSASYSSLRVNWFLIVLIVLTALGIVTSQQKVRDLTDRVHQLEVEIREAEGDARQLSLEFVSLTNNDTIANLARTSLNMKRPGKDEQLVLPVTGSTQSKNR